MSVTVYKLTDQNFKSENNTLWGEDVTHEVSVFTRLCSNGCIHAYRSPALAVMMNPIHADIKKPVLWVASTPKIMADDGVKIGCNRLTTIQRIVLPAATKAQRAEFAIRCAMLVCDDREWVNWAQGWLSGEDRSDACAARAARVAVSAAYAARAYAARAAASAAYAAYAAYAADDADDARAARAVRAAASAAADAARAADGNKNIYLKINAIAKRCVRVVHGW